MITKDSVTVGIIVFLVVFLAWIAATLPSLSDNWIERSVKRCGVGYVIISDKHDAICVPYKEPIK